VSGEPGVTVDIEACQKFPRIMSRSRLPTLQNRLGPYEENTTLNVKLMLSPDAKLMTEKSP